MQPVVRATLVGAALVIVACSLVADWGRRPRVDGRADEESA
ncbi:MAG: hypothetical protein PWQ19_176 [Tepidiphilus sp.]|nr:hypothetical protein [Tepidiphilus sp.]